MSKAFNPTSPSSVRQFLRQHKFHPSKKLGQSFLVDRGVISRIVAESGLSADETCLEIGPGLGALTEQLAEKAARVIAVEVDGRLAEFLSSTFGDVPSVKIIHADFLKVEIASLLEGTQGLVRVVANIPYSITSPIIERLLEHRERISGIVLLVQKEVAERISAIPGSRDYSSLSVFCQLHCSVRVAFTVSRKLFIPVPDVDSALLVLTPLSRDLPVHQSKELEKLVRAAFAQRRKTLVNSVSSVLGISKANVEKAVCNSGIDVGVRAEQLSVEDYIRLGGEMNG